MKKPIILILIPFLMCVKFSQSVTTNCYSVSCDALEGVCTEKSDLELKITLSDNCKRLEYCDVNDEYEGVCKTKNYYIDPLKLYPNDPCKSTDYENTCAYGLQKCGDSLTCASVGHDGECAQSADCAPHQYCNMGKCTNFKAIGEACFHRNECGRSSTCFYSNAYSITGVCTEYMKIESKSPINVKMQIDSYSVINEDSHLLCKSQYSDSTGNCSDGTVSKNKGQVCETDEDCPSTDGLAFAQCNCGWNTAKTKYCDLLPGDDEWVDVRTKFKEYFEATRENCNTDARWEQCGQSGLYNSWMCAKLRAENYAILIDENSLDCMDTLTQYLPKFSEIYLYCTYSKWISLAAVNLMALTLIAYSL